MAAIAGSLIGGGMGLLGSWLQTRSANKNAEQQRQFQLSILKALSDAQSQYAPQAQADRDMLRNMLLQSGGNAQGAFDEWLPHFRDMTYAAGPEAAKALLAGNPQSLGLTPELQALLTGSADSTGKITGNSDLAQQIFAGGGWTPQSQELFDRAKEILRGQGKEMGTMSDVGAELLGDRGQNDTTKMRRALTEGVFSSGGMTPDLQSGMKNALGIVQNGGRTSLSDALSSSGIAGIKTGGYTPGLKTLISSGTNLLNAGGENAITRALQTQGIKDYTSDPTQKALASPATSFAVDDAANQTRNAAQTLRERQALRTGSAVNSGSANAATMEGMNDILRNRSQALRTAVGDQQKLFMNEKLAGADAAASGAGLAANRMNIGGNLVQSGEQGATQRLNTFGGIAEAGGGLENNRLAQALQAIPGISNAATSRVNAFGNIDATASGEELNKMQLGGDLLNKNLSTRLNAGNLSSSTLANQLQYALQAGGLAQKGYSDTANIKSNDFNNLLNAGKFGQQLRTDQYQGILQGLQSQGQYGQLLADVFSKAMSGQGQLTSNELGLLQSILGGIGSLGGGPSSAVGGNSSTLGGILQGAAQVPWGSIFSGLAGGGSGGGAVYDDSRFRVYN